MSTYATSILMSELGAQGYTTERLTDSLIHVNADEGHFVIECDPNDEVFYRVIFPRFWSVDNEEERKRVIEAAAKATAKTKSAKVFIVDDSTWISVELFAARPEHFRNVVLRCMRAIQSARQTFMIGMMESLVE
jgi:hypothetical protein